MFHGKAKCRSLMALFFMGTRERNAMAFAIHRRFEAKLHQVFSESKRAHIEIEFD